MSKLKRHRGSQPGNQNARKHGFFSAAMSPQELCEFWQNLKTAGGDRELVALRTRLTSAFRATPGNRRVIQEASRLMTKWVCSQDAGASRKDKADAVKFIRFVCSQIGERFSKTNDALTPETEETITERILAKSG
jgi:hypothetical protein